MTAAPDHLDELCAQLQGAAARLRGGELSPDEAAKLVDACARLAADAAAELDREVRAGGQGPAARQGELL
jgi:hypothetical protein